ncbi:hypothetical protein [Paenibacillus sanguinis]|uniref:hypothetical protein n=1 Tax=Paenibacillus sanguinis TaxID=225906 RepID=UPI0003AB25AC|nr:hypothetical protein [Paenibacillus sanguinis]
MSNALDRYTPEQQAVIAQYWETVRWTRSTGKISEGIQQREHEYWAKYDPALVIRALRIHIEKYPNIKENYTRGILRNLQKGGAAHGKPEGHHAFPARTGAGSQVKGRTRDANAEAAFRRRLDGL